MNLHWMFGVKKTNKEESGRAWYSKLFRSLLFDLLLVMLFLLGALVFYLFTGVGVANAETYQLLVSGLPGLSETDASKITLGEYINILYRLAIGLGSVLAVLMLVWNGFQYMVTDIPGAKSNAKQSIGNVLLGLVLLLTSYLILNTINPELVNLKFEAPNTSTGSETLDISKAEITTKDFKEETGVVE